MKLFNLRQVSNFPVIMVLFFGILLFHFSRKILPFLDKPDIHSDILTAFGLVFFGIFFAASAIYAFPNALVATNEVIHKNSKKIILGSFIFYGLVFTLGTVLRHLSYGSHIMDFTAFIQPLYNTSGLHQILELTWEDGVNRPRMAGGQVEMVLLPLALIYKVFPSPITLLVIQSIVMGFTVFPLGRICQTLAPKNGILLLSAMVLFLTCTPLHYVNIFDFHPYGLIAPGLLYAILFYVNHDTQKLYWPLAYLMLIRNDLALYCIPVALLVGLRREFKHALFILVMGLGYYAFIVAVFSPLFGEVPVRMDKYVHHRDLGSSAGEIALNVLMHPVKIFFRLFNSADKVRNFIVDIWPYALLPLLFGIDILLIAGPFLLLYYLPSSSIFTHPYHQYDASYMPVILGAAIVGCIRISAVLEKIPALQQRHSLYIKYLFSMSLLVLCCVRFNVWDFKIEKGYSHFIEVIERYTINFAHYQLTDEAVEYVNKNVPYDARLMAASSLAPHVSNRKYIFSTRHSPDGMDYYFTDVPNLVHEFLGRGGTVERITYFLQNGNYIVDWYNDGIILIKKVPKLSDSDRKKNDEILAKIKER